ncbi:hypothetical protein [uncultured Zoogloea sp.]|uniref:hypothetical protein n=1 Tax=uncultured Zoogloea sp. TaxID=160237 RepID=UPI002622510C|nr:hypothetical protein [uncultured Zoogloea sp.]
MYTASIDIAVRAAEHDAHRMSWLGRMPPWVLRLAVAISGTWLVVRIDHLSDRIVQNTFRLDELSAHVSKTSENGETIDPNGKLEDMLDDTLSTVRGFRETVQRIKRSIQIKGMPEPIKQSVDRLAAVLDENITAAVKLRWDLLEHDASLCRPSEGFVARSPSELDALFDRIEHGAR